MPGQTDDQTVNRILALESQRCDALTGSDVDALERLFSDDLFYVHSSSRIDSKKSYIDSIRAGTLHYKKIDRDEVIVRIRHGNTAVVTGRAKVTTVSKGEEKTSSIRYTNIWIRNDRGSDVWLFTNWHAAPIPMASS